MSHARALCTWVAQPWRAWSWRVRRQQWRRTVAPSELGRADRALFRSRTKRTHVLHIGLGVKCNGHGDRCVGLAFVYVGHTHSTRRQMYIVCVCVSSTLRVPFRYPSGSLLRSKLDPLASMGWFAAAWALLAEWRSRPAPSNRKLVMASPPGTSRRSRTFP